MPLLPGKSKKAFSKNVEMEMKAGKPQKQSLAIAYASKSRSPKKMADGGQMPNASPSKGPWIDPNAAKDVEKGATKSGWQPDEWKKNIKSAFGMAEGGEIRAGSSRPNENSRNKRSMDMMDDESTEHGPELDARNEKMSGIDGANDPLEMGMMDDESKKHGREIDFKTEKRSSIDDSDKMEHEMMDSHPRSHKAEKRAGTSMVNSDSEDSMEMEMLRMAGGGSIADRIMKRKYARGGEVDLQDNNGDEHLNMEDDLSYKAARKNTYFDDSQISEQPEDSNEHGDDLPDADEHDLVDIIRNRMLSKRRK